MTEPRDDALAFYKKKRERSYVILKPFNKLDTASAIKKIDEFLFFY